MIYRDNGLEVLLEESIRQVKEKAMQTNGAVQPAVEASQGMASRSPADVYRAICEVATAISHDGIAKGRRNEQQGYGFRGIDDVYNALSALLANADLCILPRMLSRTQEERRTANDKVLFYVTVHADFDFVSARDGSRHTITMYGEAMDSADKATNKAMSAAYKYACMQVFCIPTEGMNDADGLTHEPAPKAHKAPAKASEAVAAPPVDTGGHPMNTQAAADYVRDQKIEALRAKIGPTQPDMLWLEGMKSGPMNKEFLKLRDKMGSLAYFEELERFGVKDPMTFKSRLRAVECYQSMIARLRAEAVA